MRCVALEDQQSLRDVAQLSQVAAELTWISADKLPSEPGLAILCGLWLQDGGQAAADILHKRSEAGLATLLVPRFKAGNLAGLLGAPTAIEIRPGDFSEVVWSDDGTYAVSGVSHFKTSLHAGNWAKAEGNGTAIIGFRLHATAGPVVLCSAALTSRPLGIRIEEQQRLLEQIVSSITAMGIVSKPVEPVKLVKDTAPLCVESFLDEFGEQGASLLLAIVAAEGDREADLIAKAKYTIGLRLTDETVELLNRLSETPLQEIETVLQNFGWGAYLRRICAQAQSRGY